MPLTVGALVERSLGVFTRRFVLFVLVELIVTWPLPALALLEAEGVLRLPAPAALVTGVPYLVLAQVATGAITHGVIGELRGRRAGLGACLGAAVARVTPLAALGALLFVVVTATFAAAFFAARIAGAATAELLSPAAADVLSMAVLVVPLAALYARLVVAAPAVVVEGVGAVEALRRTLLLTAGRARPLFVVVVVLAGALLAAQLGAAALAAASPALALAVSLAASTVIAALTSTTCATAYHLLRQDKEGLDLATVFD